MNDEQLPKLIESAVSQAASTIALDTFLWGLGGAVLALLLFVFVLILFKLVMGAVRGVWAGAWTAVFVVTVVVLLMAGGVVGGGEGFLHGAETALRQTEFGRDMLDRVANGTTALYAIAYYTDPEEISRGGIEELGNLARLDEVRKFASGGGRLDARKLDERMQQFRGEDLRKMAREVEQTVGDNPLLREQLPGAADAMDLIVDFAFEERLDEAVAETESGEGPLSALMNGVPDAAALHGDPSTVTQAELREHLTERVIVPAVMSPLKALIRPWQWLAAIVAGVVVVFALLFRIVAWSVGRKEEDASTADGTV